jgi:pantoate--beta-alanine ligase
MTTLRTKQELHDFLETKATSKSVGFVPTMGALHEGHLSLLKKAQEKDEIVICSIFVNPTQFNEASDYDSYPKVLAEDLNLLSKLNIDAVFAPNVSQIYPKGTEKIPHYEIGSLDSVLEGKHRPGHFQGVCHIIEVFLKMIKPDHIYMGEKDFQQIAVVQKLIEIKKHKTKLVPCATLRKESGLAMSSRNTRLSEEGKMNAAVFHQSLCFIRENSSEESFSVLKEKAELKMKAVGFTPEYIALCNANTLEELSDFKMNKPMRLIGAAFLEDVRLIDNIAI